MTSSKFISKINLLLAALLITCSCSKNDPEPVPEKKDTSGAAAYLFAHMTDDNYGKLYYCVSRDGQNWTALNGGKQIESKYIGHPAIAKGGDGKYYMLGIDRILLNSSPVLWTSTDLINWSGKILKRSIFDLTSFGADNTSQWIGAPKIFYDSATKRYIISWHSFQTGITDNDKMWESMRTYYVQTSDWVTFTTPARLFNFSGADANMATIDAIIVKENNTYYAVIKDERWPKTASTGKTIRIASSSLATGPYSNPGPAVTPAWREAPTVVPTLDGKGFFLYCEEYPVRYEGFKASTMAQTKWESINVNFPDGDRHGCVITLTEKEYQALIKAFN